MELKDRCKLMCLRFIAIQCLCCTYSLYLTKLDFKFGLKLIPVLDSVVATGIFEDVTQGTIKHYSEHVAGH